jgi:hypothetical protein
MAGMVFSADGYKRGSVGYNVLTTFVAGTIIVATASFAALLVFEVYRSVKFAEAHALARRVEEEALEEAVLGKWRRRSPAAGADGSPSGRSSALGAVARNSSLGRRVSVALGWSPASSDPVGAGPGDALDAAGPLLHRHGSSRVVARQRRESLLARLQGIVRAASSAGGEAGIGRGGPAANVDPDGKSEPPLGARSLTPLHPPPARTPLVSAPTDGGGPEARSGPFPPPPPHDDSEGPGTSRAGVDTFVLGKAAARSLRVLNMAAKERTPAA